MTWLTAACGSSGLVSPSDDDTARLVPTQISGPFSLVQGFVAKQPGSAPLVMYGVAISNPSSNPMQVVQTGCWAFLRLYARSDRTGTPAYDSGPPDVDCLLYSHRITVPAGTTTRISEALFIDPRLAGHYFASVAIAPNGSATVIPAGEVDIIP